MSVPVELKEPFVATEAEAAVARKAAAKLRPLTETKADIKLRVVEGSNDIVLLPARAMELIVEFLDTMAERQPVSVVSHAAELTTQEAADHLNVSRPYLIGLLDRGEIPHRMVGSHRRVQMADLLAYKHKSDESRRNAIRKMVAEAQRLSLP